MNQQIRKKTCKLTGKLYVYVNIHENQHETIVDEILVS